MKAQLSAEMLILIVVVLAVIALVGAQLLSTAKEGGKTIDTGSSTIFNKTLEGVKSGDGEPCDINKNDEDCKLGYKCVDYECKKN